MNSSVLILLAVFVLIAVRQVGRIRLAIWQIMLGGALVVLLAGQISPSDALRSINPDVLLFLFGMFVVGAALEESGYLAHLSYKILRYARGGNSLMLMILFGLGLFSAILMNDTIAIIGTPLVLHFSKKLGMPAKPLLLALAFAVTIGSVMSPIGNPQNLLIAIGGEVHNPFISFLKYLALPTLLNLFLAYLLLKFFYRDSFKECTLKNSQETIKDSQLAFLCKISLALTFLMIAAKILVVSLNFGFDFRLTYIALAAAFPLLAFSKKRSSIARNIDWHTLIFFAAMFVLMESVWNSGFFQSVLSSSHADIASLPVILAAGVLVSQLVSNVPFVALYLPLLREAGTSTAGMMALAAGSTIAGNLFILGAASNVIIIQNAEKKGETLTFFEFARIGIPLTILNVVVYWLFLRWA